MIDGMLAVALTAVLAQEASGLAAKVHTGQRVVVVDTSGRETGGTVQAVSDDRLVVDYGVGQVRAFTVDEVAQVNRTRLWDGAVKGAAIGLVPAVLSLLPECVGCPRAGRFAGLLALSAGLGLAMDAAGGPDIVYRRGSRRVALAPMIGRDGAALAASIRF
jgi:hypothetical protein